MICEVCVDSLGGALAAEMGGADRIELCGPLSLGGITPSLGLVRAVRAACRLPIMAMIRPHDRDFVYTEMELNVMLQDMEVFRDEGIQGFVFGALQSDLSIDLRTTECLVAAGGSMDTTFHRAFDELTNLESGLRELIDLGVARVLTSGGAASAGEAIDLLRQLVESAGEGIRVMPGGGIHEENIAEVVRGTHAGEVHFSARAEGPASTAPPPRFSPPSSPWQVTSMSRVRALCIAAREAS